jgi:anti-sigma factor RsiW
MSAVSLSGDSQISCREASGLLAPFVDGELDARQMRAVALHGTRCSSCEAELRSIERLRGFVVEMVQTRVDQVDFARLWQGIEPRLVRPARARSGIRWRSWWEQVQPRPWLAWPAFAAAAAGGLLAFYLYAQDRQPVSQPGTPVIATIDAPALIDSLDTETEAVAVVNDPARGATILWVGDSLPAGDWR